MKRNRFFSLRFIIAFASMLAILASVASFTPETVSASVNMGGGGTEECTTQICPELPADHFPLTITITYEDGSTQTITYDGPTVRDCPEDEFEGGHVVPGIRDAGKIVSAEVTSEPMGWSGVVEQDGGPVEITVDDIEITIRITRYSGRIYIRIRVRIIG